MDRRGARIRPMLSHLRRWLPWLCLWLVLTAAGAAVIAHQALQRRQDAFETDARIAHRVLSQRVAQHDAMLDALALLQPAAGDAPEQRLPAVYPQLLRVLRSDAARPWPADPALSGALSAAEAASRAQRRAVLMPLGFDRGRYWLVRAAAPASFALQIDIRRLLVPGEWPLPAGSPVQARLVQGGDAYTLNAGSQADSDWRFTFSKHLASASQPFDLRLDGGIGWEQLPWAWMLGWAVLCAALLLGARQWWRQQADRRRTHELLRLGQVGRLNALGELAAGIAHELNQPLTAVVADAGAARRLLDDDEPDLRAARQAMDHACQQARRAADVLSRMRRLLERPESGAPPRALRVAPVLDAALDLWQADLRRLGVRTTVRCEPPALEVQAEPVALEQILHNLLSNALHALGQVPQSDRRLELAASAAGTRVLISVHDSGPGIAAELLPRLFEPFVTTRGAGEGLGLGLSLSETLAIGLGGSLAAANAGPRGAEFRLELPLAATH